MNRRAFLLGSAAVAVAAAAPALPVIEAMPPIFNGAIGEWRGVAVFSVEHVKHAKGLLERMRPLTDFVHFEVYHPRQMIPGVV